MKMFMYFLHGVNSCSRWYKYGYTLTVFIVFLCVLQIRKDLILHKSHVEIFIPQAKTDQLRQGRTVFIAKVEGSECPVRLLLLYAQLAGFQLGKSSDTYFFTRCIFKKKKICLHDTMVVLSYNNVRFSNRQNTT